jgi:hypothetical protein
MNALWHATYCLQHLTSHSALLLDIHEVSTSIRFGVLAIQEDLSNIVRQSENDKLDLRQGKLLQWLSPVDSTQSHNATLQQHQKGTGEWIIRSTEVSEWMDGSGCLWVSGSPGTGKTLLFSTLVHWIQGILSKETDGSVLAYYYCDFRKSESQEPVNIIGSLVAQVCVHLGYFPQELEDAYDQSTNVNGQIARPTMEALVSSLETLATRRKLILLIDALDECNDSKAVAQVINKTTGTDSSINVLVSSRDEVHIQQQLSMASRLSIGRHGSQVSDDIRSYINTKLDNDPGFLWLKPSFKAEIQVLLNNKSGSMFRWVQCQLDLISTLKSVRSIRKALNDLPKDLEQTYESILKRVSPYYTQHVRNVLLWLTFGAPLRLDELSDAILIDPELDYLDEEARLSEPEDILDLCNSLINVTDNGFVRLAHLSVRDYLLSETIQRSSVAQFALQPKEAKREICTNCISYLSMKDFTSGPATSSPLLDLRRSQFPLIEHAAVQWPYYSRAAGEPPELDAIINKFFDNENRPQFMSWIQVLNALPSENVEHSRAWNSYPRHATPLYYASSFGLIRTVRYLIDQGVALDAPGSRFGGSAMHGAIIRGHLDVVKMLVEAGADVNCADFTYMVPLHQAAVQEQEDIALLLLEHGAVWDSEDLDYEYVVIAEEFIRSLQRKRGAVVPRVEVETGLPGIERIDEFVKDASGIASFSVEM